MSPERPASGVRRGPRRLLALVAALAAVLSVLLARRDVRMRRGLEALVRASEAERAGDAGVRASDPALEPAWDLEAGAAADDALAGESPVSAETRRLALASMRSALAERPGWPIHRLALALSDEPPAGERARRTLALAAAGAAGFDPTWAALAKADLDAWNDLSGPDRAGAEAALRRASDSPAFVSREYPRIVAAVGGTRAAALLADDSEVIERAAGSLAQAGDVPGAASLLARAERAERREGVEQLQWLERRRALNDVEGLRLGVLSWFHRHPLAGLDDPEGHRQLSRLLELWPDDRFGSWPQDRRARIFRFFLEGRLSDVSPEAIRRTLPVLNGVPDSIRARLELAAGDPAAAREIARAGERESENEGEETEDWSGYVLDLSRRELAAGRAAEARRVLSTLAPEARGGCGALLLRREIAGRLGDGEEREAASRALAPLAEPEARDFSSRGSLPMCLDPERNRTETLEIAIGPGKPAILTWGWDGGRRGTVFVPEGEGSVNVSLEGLAGPKTLWTSFLVGGEGRTLHALLRRAS